MYSGIAQNSIQIECPIIGEYMSFQHSDLERRYGTLLVAILYLRSYPGQRSILVISSI